MLSIAAIALAAASAAASPALIPTSPWWEKITVTYDGDGSKRSCAHETSFSRDRGPCEIEDAPASPASGEGTPGIQTTITFERRFTPGTMPKFDRLEPGDTLLGGHVMRVAIDRSGAVRGCSVIGATGDARLAYDCDQVRAERFQASAGAARQEGQTGFLTVLVYGREEQIA